MRKTSKKSLTESEAATAASRSGGLTSIYYTMLMPVQNSLLYDGKGLVLSLSFNGFSIYNTSN
ncbi:MAG: hypothetical protein ACFE9L_16100, partial [Candidatus Hodarchaeota archaeon]